MNTVRRLIKEIGTSPQREGLESDIFRAIALARESQRKRNLFVSSVGLFLSGGAVVYASIVYGSIFFGSEFWSIISLLFSDAAVVINYWNEFFLLLLETIPIVPTLLLLVPTFVFLMFLGMYARTTHRHHFSY
jgi:hypothetical protein